ncbi:MAG: GTPase Era [Rhodothermales bacterium]|nr:GTPase Era [Rhodothermales bacterium]MBO6780389.1 GTPase Era [Rhodothermales bacterium]
MTELHRTGYAALLGRPNVGKSTLVNRLVGQKISIVTRKPQTTRTRVLGIVSEPGHQLILLDTPGVIKPSYGLQSSMMRAVEGAVRDADVVLFLADVTYDTPDTLSLEYTGGKPVILVLNKMDRIAKEEALPLVEAYGALREFADVVPVSALKGDNVDTLMSVILEHLPPGPPLYPEDMLSEQPERFFVAEIIREKIFERYRQEVPYATQVNIVDYREEEGQKDVIDAEIVVERDTQKGILIGKGGQALKAVGTAARADIEAFLERPVFLRLFVKVRGDWRNSDTFLKSYGYRD